MSDRPASGKVEAGEIPRRDARSPSLCFARRRPSRCSRSRRAATTTLCRPASCRASGSGATGFTRATVGV
jgi:hypothetical protein